MHKQGICTCLPLLHRLLLPALSLPAVACSSLSRLPASLPSGLDDVTLGRLEDLQRGGKGGMDPNGVGNARLASDVLWSDPVGEPGFHLNVARGVGMCFGPDVTEVGSCFGG